jgi:hypothetical protein
VIRSSPGPPRIAAAIVEKFVACGAAGDGPRIA